MNSLKDSFSAWEDISRSCKTDCTFIHFFPPKDENVRLTPIIQAETEEPVIPRTKGTQELPSRREPSVLVGILN